MALMTAAMAAGITDAQALQMAKGLAVTGDLTAAAQQIKNLYKLFNSCDCTMVEVGTAEWRRVLAE
jgi:succinyl-CoA synthetase beta subunit